MNDAPYYEFEEEERIQALAQKKKKQQKKLILTILLLGAGLGYYFLIYLPEEEIKKLENQLQAELDRVKSATPDDVAEILTTLQTYQQWVNGNEFEQRALANKQTEFNEAMQWLQEHQKSPEQSEKELEDQMFLKGAIWKLPAKSWADNEIRKISNILVGRYNEDAKLFPDGDKHEDFHFTRSASYDIYFPPSMEEFYKLGKATKKNNCQMLTKNEDLIWSSEIENWYNQVTRERPPWRGNPNPTTKKDNNAIFFGAPGTGKSATVKKICIEADECPLVIVKGSSLTPTKQDYDAGISPLQKFVYTISELEWTLVKVYGMERESNGEVRYMLFVDECDQISNNSLIHDPNKLRFLKECLEGSESSRTSESRNLWIMATNHLEDVDSAAYREGRLSNPLDFSWTWEEFKKYFEDAKRNPTKYKLPNDFNIPDLPARWQETDGLNEEDNKWVNKFNKFSFVADFLGYDPEKPNRPKFWELFITNNPDAIFKEEIEVKDENDNETIETEVEIGEFLQFFWQKKESGQLASYGGKFETPRIPKTAEVLDDNLPNLGEVADILAQSSNAINQNLEFIREQIEKTAQIVQTTIASQNNSGVQNQIMQLRQDLANLAQEVHRK